MLRDVTTRTRAMIQGIFSEAQSWGFIGYLESPHLAIEVRAELRKRLREHK